MEMTQIRQAPRHHGGKSNPQSRLEIHRNNQELSETLFVAVCPTC